MNEISDGLSAFLELSMNHMNALISLGGLAVAILALYVALVVVKERKRR